MSIRYMAVSAAVLSGTIILAGSPPLFADGMAGDTVAQQGQVEARMQQLFQNRERQRIHRGDGEQGAMAREQTRNRNQIRSRSMSGSAGGGIRGKR